MDKQQVPSGRLPPNRIVQISAMANGCFGLTAEGRVWVCVYDAVIDEWIWHETARAPGVQP